MKQVFEVQVLRVRHTVPSRSSTAPHRSIKRLEPSSTRAACRSRARRSRIARRMTSWRETPSAADSSASAASSTSSVRNVNAMRAWYHLNTMGHPRLVRNRGEPTTECVHLTAVLGCFLLASAGASETRGSGVRDLWFEVVQQMSRPDLGWAGYRDAFDLMPDRESAVVGHRCREPTLDLVQDGSSSVAHSARALHLGFNEGGRRKNHPIIVDSIKQRLGAYPAWLPVSACGCWLAVTKSR